jgi:hypothetical protein
MGQLQAPAPGTKTRAATAASRSTNILLPILKTTSPAR